MASVSSILSEEQFLCSICLDIFTEPVSIQCGHNFCRACITKYWDSRVLSQCPMCNEKFHRRPDLHVNTFISEMANQFRLSVEETVCSSRDELPAKPEDVPCDICTVKKLRALKSCLVCLTSYCKGHLEPHQRMAALKKHKLIDPVENLEDRLCKKHHSPLELFCQTDQTCVCQFCTETDHRHHTFVPIEEEGFKCKAQIQKNKTEIETLIKQKQMKVTETKKSFETFNRDTEKETATSMQVFTSLVASARRTQTELIKVIEQKQEAKKKQTEAFIKELEQEITELDKRSNELEQLSHTEDYLHLLQSSPSLSTPPPTKDWSEVRVRTDLFLGTVRRAVAQLEETLNREMEKLCDIELKRIKQYAVDVTLDPDTAHPNLILSVDGKQVSHGLIRKNLPDNPERFSQCPVILGKEGFSSDRFYYEVQVKGKTAWDLGVARQSVNRKGQILPCPQNGYWTLVLRNGNEYRAAIDPPSLLLCLRKKPRKVGVFVDYEEGQVSFYDAEARVHIYSFTKCLWTEDLYPYFSTCLNDGGKNSAFLTIPPVKT
ncbi:E3 ubiquitin-protein ligase TRIM39-like [Aplochiton taeniatus]